MSTAIVLPYDPEGTNPDNHRENEQHVVSPPAKITDMSVIIPRLAPFHANETMIVSVGTAENKHPLTAGVDYKFVYRHHAASKAAGVDIYGGILFTSRSFNGNIWLDYQSIGGVLTLDDLTIVERFSRSINNVMWASWEQFVGLPSAWPIADHPVDGALLYGLDSLGVAIGNVAAALNAKNSGSGSEPIATAHITANIAHTPAQVGLGNLNNWTSASANDFNVGTNNAYATAFGVKTYLDSRITAMDLPALRARVDAVEEAVGTNQQAISTVTTALTNMGNAIAAVEEDMISAELLIVQQNLAIQNVTEATGALSGDVAANTGAIQTHTNQINTANTKVAAIEGVNSTQQTAIDGLISYNTARNPMGKIPNGTHLIMLAPTEQLDIAMVGYGGMHGKVVDDLIDYFQPRQHIGQAKLYLCTDVATGSQLDEFIVLASVSAGQDGKYSLSSSATFGWGGTKGTAIVTPHAIMKNVTSNEGVDGGDGSSDDVAIPAGGIGHAVGGVTYGVGDDGVVEVGIGSAGAGASGGWAEFTLHNESSFQLKLILVTDVRPDDRTGTASGIVSIT